jgi:hypothetical protein
MINKNLISIKNNSIICLTLLLLICLFESCSCNRTNAKGDRMEADKIVANFYSDITNKDYKSIIPLISERFWKENDTAKFFKFLRSADEKFGKINDYELIDYHTFVSVGAITSGNYTLQYKTKRDSLETKETFKMIFENDKGIKIIGYTIHVDGMIK